MDVTESSKARIKHNYNSGKMETITNENANHNLNNEHNFHNVHSYGFFNSMIFRVFALLLLLVLFLIPVSMLHQLIDDQVNTKNNTVKALSNQWGNDQTIVGPILSIPYVERISRIESQTDSSGVKSSVSKDIFNNKILMLLPENLTINANLVDKVLSENNQQAHVFQGEIELSGNFNLEALPEASGYNTIEWDKAFIAVGVTKNKSVDVSSPLRWEGSSSVFRPGTQLSNLIKQGFHSNLEEVANENNQPKFKIQLSLKGNQGLQFAPLGELTTLKIQSDSSNIKIKGDIPASSKVVSKDSFDATWRLSNLVRNYPQQWLINSEDTTSYDIDFTSVLTGVEYSAKQNVTDPNLVKIKQSINYIIPMLGILFLSLLILEFKRNSRAKPKFIHYLVISLPIVLTPLLLFTLNGTTNFIQAYQVVGGTSIVLIVLYMMSSLRSFVKGFYILLIVASLYAMLFVDLEMPEYRFFALSVVGLFITILLMMASINIQDNDS